MTRLLAALAMVPVLVVALPVWGCTGESSDTDVDVDTVCDPVAADAPDGTGLWIIITDPTEGASISSADDVLPTIEGIQVEVSASTSESMRTVTFYPCTGATGALVPWGVAITDICGTATGVVHLGDETGSSSVCATITDDSEATAIARPVSIIVSP